MEGDWGTEREMTFRIKSTTGDGVLWKKLIIKFLMSSGPALVLCRWLCC